jgi:transposase
VAEVVGHLDLGAIHASNDEKDGRGQSASAPAMMLRVLLYGCCTGTYSSRKLQAKSYDDVAIRYLSADEHPDHATISEFRRRHLKALGGLFAQALRMCSKAGLVKLGHVAIDGSKIKANASKHKAMSYSRMDETEQLLAQAEATDAAEDTQYGKGKLGDELPAELEQEAGEKAEQGRAGAEAKIVARREQEKQTGKKARARDPKVPDLEQAVPAPKAQRNFTDPESRIMPDGANKGSFLQGYNAQAAVDAEVQIIVAADLTQQSNDSQ